MSEKSPVMLLLEETTTEFVFVDARNSAYTIFLFMVHLFFTADFQSAFHAIWEKVIKFFRVT